MPSPPKALTAHGAEHVSYPWLAAVLTRQLETRGWTVADLNRALGKAVSHPTAYRWLRGEALPSTQNVLALSDLFGLPETAFLPPHDDPRHLLAVSPQSNEVFDFSIRSDGTACVRLNVRLPIDQAMPLIHMLMDAGLVFSQVEGREYSKSMKPPVLDVHATAPNKQQPGRRTA